jgi:hypothetical protein
MARVAAQPAPSQSIISADLRGHGRGMLSPSHTPSSQHNSTATTTSKSKSSYPTRPYPEAEESRVEPRPHVRGVRALAQVLAQQRGLHDVRAHLEQAGGSGGGGR